MHRFPNQQNFTTHLCLTYQQTNDLIIYQVNHGYEVYILHQLLIQTHLLTMLIWFWMDNHICVVALCVSLFVSSYFSPLSQPNISLFPLPLLPVSISERVIIKVILFLNPTSSRVLNFCVVVKLSKVYTHIQLTKFNLPDNLR